MVYAPTDILEQSSRDRSGLGNRRFPYAPTDILNGHPIGANSPDQQPFRDRSWHTPRPGFEPGSQPFRGTREGQGNHPGCPLPRQGCMIGRLHYRGFQRASYDESSLQNCSSNPHHTPHFSGVRTATRLKAFRSILTMRREQSGTAAIKSAEVQENAPEPARQAPQEFALSSQGRGRSGAVQKGRGSSSGGSAPGHSQSAPG